jgi:serine/threonine-protein phosphatase 2A regulatory subunit A
LLTDNESEVRHAAIKNISKCLRNFSTDKISALLLPTLQSTFSDGSAPFKAGAASAVCDMAEVVGKNFTATKIYPMIAELLKDESSEVKLSVVQGMNKIARVVGADILNGMNTAQPLLPVLEGMAKDGQWRVRMSVLELVADLGILFGKTVFTQKLQTVFLSYMTNTAASVREMGVKKSALLAQEFREDWVLKDFIPQVLSNYKADQKGYNYRMCCLYAVAAVLPFIHREHVASQVVPLFMQAFKDTVPNVKFCVCKIIN